MANRNFPYDVPASGWFQVAWSSEVPPGAVRPLRYFGQDLVLYRGDAGEAYVLDAYCPHLGAHLGFGGKVCDDEIECPFHGWRWDAQGRNTEIPYADRPNRSQRIRAWQVREAHGLIMVWHDATGAGPTWEPPLVPEAVSDDYYDPFPDCVKLWEHRRLLPQMIAENAVDPAHQKFVHGASDVSTIEAFSADGPRFHARHRVVYGRGKGATWLTPQGEIVAFLDAELYGMGIAIARFEGTDDAVHLQCQTPVDDEYCDLRVTVLAKREPGHETPSGKTVKRIEHQWRQVDNDLVIWEHMRYEKRPPLAAEEARPYQAFRRWAEQFYVPGTTVDVSKVTA